MEMNVSLVSVKLIKKDENPFLVSLSLLLS